MGDNMGRASFYVVVLATLNRVPLMLPILSLPGPEPSTPEPIYAPAPPEDGSQDQQPAPDSSEWVDTSEPRNLASSFEDVLYTAAGTCPNTPLWEITAGRHQEIIEPPKENVESYEAKGLLGADGMLAMDYAAIENGGSMCLEQSNPEDQVVLGGMFFWEQEDGQCMLPPKNDAGNPCCMVYMWQPNAEGMYYGDCTMKMALHPHGLYYFTTVIPGNEVMVGWGEDPAPHIHYDVICSDCTANSAFSGGSYAWWGKVYPEALCHEASCGKPGAVHQVQEKQEVNGQMVYKYDFVLPRIQDA